SKRLVIDTDRPIEIRPALGREIEQLEHGGADHPLVADQRLNDIGISIARSRNQFAGTELRVEVTANFAHPLVVPFDCPVRIFVLQFDSVQRALLESKQRALQTGMNQSL